jgi:uncharacterized membrane protein YphA (DoxX/SURF4 family)
MNAPRFPRSPDIHNRPFEDGNSGKNPFTDSEQAATPNSVASNPAGSASSAYQTRVVDDRRPTQSGDYDAVLATRSRPLFILSVIGFVLSGLSVLLAVMAISSVDWVDGMFYGAPVSLTTIAFSIPAWVMAHVDLRAIRAGAMNPDGRRRTRIAYWLGCLGTLIGIMPAFASIVAVVFTLLDQ